jgi:hypothetical protein
MSFFQLQFGAFAPPLRQQLIDGGFELTKPVTKSSLALTHLQRDAEAVARLRIRGRIPTGTAISVERKIAKEVGKLITKGAA